MTAIPSHPAVAVGFEAPNDVLPSRWDHGFDILLLLMVAAGDAVSFWIALQAFNASASAGVMLVLVGAMTAAAVVTMHKAGGYARAFKARQAAHGRLMVVVLVGAWLFLGAAAFVVRMNSQEAFASTDLFGSGTVVPEGHNVIMAILMLALFLAGGVVAYGIGFASYNPRRTAVLRLRRALNRLERRQRTQQRRQRKSRAGLADRAASLDRQVAAAELEMASNRALLGAQAEELKQIARLRMAAALSTPSRTSGVFAQMGERP